MERPFIVTLLGWLGILAYTLFLIGIVLQLGGWIAPTIPLDTGAPIPIAMSALGLAASLSLLHGRRWARIYLTLGLLIATCRLWFFPEDLLAIYPPAHVQATTILCSGFALLLLCLLYSPAANHFFRPHKDPVLFNHYNAVRQLTILAAFAVIGYGGYASWQASAHADVSATTTNPDAPKHIRTFTNTQGVSIQARLIYFDGAQVILEREDGRRFTNPITIYSDQDQAYIRQQPAR